MVQKVILKISQYSFGIYLVHIIVIEQLGRLGITASRWNPVIAVPLVVCIVFIISLVISAILNNIPVVKSTLYNQNTSLQMVILFVHISSIRR